MTMFTNSASFPCIAWKEVSWSAWIEPVSRPVSCWGKKPFGIFAYRKTVAAIVASVTTSVSGWCRKTQPSDLS